MITLKSRDEIAAIRRAGLITRLVLNKIEEAIRPGITTLELDRLAADIVNRNAATLAFKGYRGFPANICTSVNEVVVHGIPSKRKLVEGDIVGIDVGIGLNGYYADAAATFPVGKISEDAARLIKVASGCLERAISMATADNRLSDISNSVQECAEGALYSVVRAFVGHGIGSEIHEEPEIPNFGQPHRGVRLEPGMVLAIEPMINAGVYQVEVLKDGWTAATKDLSLSAHFEDTVAVTDKEPEVLTR